MAATCTGGGQNYTITASGMPDIFRLCVQIANIFIDDTWDCAGEDVQMCYTETDGSLLWRPILGKCNASIIEDVWSKATNNTWGAISCPRTVADSAAVAEEGHVQLSKVRRQFKAGRNGNGLF